MDRALSRRERVLAAVSGDPVDRPPMSFWGHFYDREQTAADLADATLEAQDRFDWDFVKLNPRASYHVENWGVSFLYAGDPLTKPVRTAYPIHDPGDYEKIQPLPPDSGALGEQLEAIRLVRRGLPDDVLLLETVFLPLAIVADLAQTGIAVRDHLKSDPDRVQAALESVTRTFTGFVTRALEAGADGIFFATVDWGTRDLWTFAEYREIAGPYDRRLLAAAQGARFNVLHVCRPKNFLLQLADYPVHAFSWAATDPTNPNLAEGLQAIRGAAVGGIGHEDALVVPENELALSQLEEGFSLTGGRRWIVAPGCSILPQTPPDRLRALREAILSHA